MTRKHVTRGATLAVALAILVTLPAWSGGHEPAPAEQAPARGYLGVELERLTPELQAHFGAPEGRGVLVASVADDSPAAAAGIRVGDVITAVEGLPVGSPRELAREVRHRPAAEVDIELYRDRTARTLRATLGERQAHAGAYGGRSPEEWAELAEHWQRWGEELGERMGRLGEQFGERFGERWGEEHAAEWQRWAEEMAARGEGWGEMGEEIGRTVEKALSEVDWEEIGRIVEQSLRSVEGIEGVDWEEIGARIERQMAELERRLEAEREAEGDPE